MSSTHSKIAFACSWWSPRETTWSYTPLSLREALLENGINLHDINAQPPRLIKAVLAGALVASGFRPWKYSKPYRMLEAHRVRRAADTQRPDAVLELADLVVPTAFPTFAYQDMNFSVAANYHAELGRDMVSTIPTTRSVLEDLAAEQNERYKQLDGVFVMGKWYADFLAKNGIVSSDRIFPVGGGISTTYRKPPLRSIRPLSQRTRVLFVGSDFFRKGGDHVLNAVRQINQSGERLITLTIAGPASWPMTTPAPEWVDFRGALPRTKTFELFASHDLFVMPSRFEAYGVVFLEARAMGLPCIGREAFAMPELIEPGLGGAVWKSNEVSDLASLIHDCLRDDALHERCARTAVTFASDNSWSKVGERIMNVITGPNR